MRRREFVGGLVGAVALPIAALPQPVERLRRIGLLSLPTAEVYQSGRKPFAQVCATLAIKRERDCHRVPLGGRQL
jgi:hypothetical protein